MRLEHRELAAKVTRTRRSHLSGQKLERRGVAQDSGIGDLQSRAPGARHHALPKTLFAEPEGRRRESQELAAVPGLRMRDKGRRRLDLVAVPIEHRAVTGVGDRFAAERLSDDGRWRFVHDDRFEWRHLPADGRRQDVDGSQIVIERPLRPGRGHTSRSDEHEHERYRGEGRARKQGPRRHGVFL